MALSSRVNHYDRTPRAPAQVEVLALLSAPAGRRAAMRYFTAFVVLVALFLTPAAAETRIALVMGNAKYVTSPLRNARRDAELMGRVLSETGFDVISVLDGEANAMRAAVLEFSRRLKQPDSIGLFYYAGHGVQEDGENYLIPLSADIGSMSEVALNALALGDIMKVMVAAETRLNIVILDACRDNPFAETRRGPVRGGLAPVVAPSGTIIGYATAPGQIARDGTGANSPYTAALAGNIAIAGLTLEEVFRSTRRAVLAATDGRQTPWEHSSLVGAYYFKPKATTAEPSIARVEVMPTDDARFDEVEAWERIKSSKNPAVFKAHIASYPSGLFAELAAVRIAKLDSMRAQTPWSWIMTGAVVRNTGGAEAAATFERAVLLDGSASTDADRRIVASLYLEAAEHGIPQAMYQVARAYDKGRGMARDLAEAARWYGSAAELGHAGAMASLGTMYEFGEGTRLDLVEALRFYKLAADAGDAAGLTNLAYMLAEGKGAAMSQKAARHLYASAAAKGQPRAMFNLALMQLRAQGGRRDVKGALENFRRAAVAGHTSAHQELATIFDEGRFAPKSTVKAAGYLISALKAARKDGRTLEILSRPWSFATRRELQRQLAAKGLYHGLIHGFFDRATRTALAQLAAD